MNFSKLAVTGATGYIGGAVLRELLASGYRVRCLARCPEAKSILPAACELAVGDVSDRPSLVEAFQGCEAVFHLAAAVKSWLPRRRTFREVNVEGTRNVLEAASQVGIKRLVYTSSFLALGPSRKAEKLSERPPPRRRRFHNQYERTKTEALALVDDYTRKGFPCVTVIPTVVFGPGRSTEGNLIGNMIREFLRGKFPGIVGDGSQVWNFAYVDDVARGHRLALEKGILRERYILGGESLSLNDFFRQLSRMLAQPEPAHVPVALAKVSGWIQQARAKMLRRPPEFTRGAVAIFSQNWDYSWGNAKRHLGYRVTPFTEGLAHTVGWLQKSVEPTE